MAAELQRVFPGRVQKVKLIPSSGGVFEVKSGERLVFSKRQLGRFPNPGEVEGALGAA